jgi:ElaB/YqjD/DUF883 family membrane-anchored ribosome-binding protein
MQLTPTQEQKLHDIVSEVKQRAGKLANQASEKIQEIHPQEKVRQAGQLIKNHPVQSLAIGATVGGLLGALLAHQRKVRRA